MGLIPGGVKTKLIWLLTALVIVWIGGPGGGGEGTPTAATAASRPESSVAAPAGNAPTGEESVEVGVARGGVAEGAGVRLGVLATGDEPGFGAGGVPDGSRVISVYVALKNVSEHDMTFTALDLELLYDKSRYASLEARRGPGPMLTFGLLAPGEAASGWRMFRVPAGEGPFRLAFVRGGR